MSVNRRVKKMWYKHSIKVEYSSMIKKNKIMPFVATLMYLETVILSEVKSEKDKYRISLIYGIQFF